jgi:hypothetical protein
VTVTNANPTAGGSHTVTPKIVQSDIDAAQANVFSQLDAQFQSALQSPAAVASGQSLFSQSAHLGVAICDPDPQTLLNQAVASFQLDCKGTGTATMADATNIRALAERRVKASVRTGYLLVENSVTADVGAPVAQGSTVVVPVTVSAVQVPVVDLNALRTAILGMSVEEARTYLSQYGKVDISVSPDWASTMPSFDFRIDIELIAPSAHPSGSTSPSGSVRTSSPGLTAPPSEGTGGSSAATPSVSPAVSPSPSASASIPADSLAPSAAPTNTPPPSSGASSVPSSPPSPSATPA